MNLWGWYVTPADVAAVLAAVTIACAAVRWRR